jgi:hypothetical protein
MNPSAAQIQLLERRRLLSGMSYEDIVAELANHQNTYALAVEANQAAAQAAAESLANQYQLAAQAAAATRAAGNQAAVSLLETAQNTASAAEAAAIAAAGQAKWQVESNATAHRPRTISRLSRLTAAA